jgi:hypothetical protein
MEGLEPPRLAAPDPKSGAATNYATSGRCAGAAILPAIARNATPEILAAATSPIDSEMPASGKKERKFIQYIGNWNSRHKLKLKIGDTFF